MPIDSRIPLLVQAPNFKSFADAAREAAAFQTQQQQAQQNLQLGQQQIQLNNQRMADAATEKARTLKDQEEADKINKYFLESGGDLDKTYDLAIKNGVSADRALKLKRTGIQVKQQLQQMNDADLQRTTQKHARIAEYITSVRNAAPDARPQMYQAALAKAVSEGDIDQDTYAKMLQAGVPGDQDLDTMLATYGGPGAPLAAELARREAAKKAEDEARLKEDTARKGREADRAEAYNTFSSVSGQNSYTEWRNSLRPSIRGEYPNKYDPATVPDLVRRKARTVAQQDASDNAARDKSVTEWEVLIGAARSKLPVGATQDQISAKALELKAQQTAAERKPTTPQVSSPKEDPEAKAWAEIVMKNPAMMDKLTPTMRGKVGPILKSMGYQDFETLSGQNLSDTAIKQISSTQSALDSLKDLRTILHENEQFIGPVSGLQAKLPWSDARKVQADIDRVRQRVGKALEGGVLRKEDEAKYQKILATLTDEPSTAIYKLDQIAHELENDLNTYKETQKSAGRRVDTSKKADSASGKPSAKGDPLGIR